ncbi:MAG: class I SAM-dependent methyltransferase [Nanobdellota archaeon]
MNERKKGIKAKGKEISDILDKLKKRNLVDERLKPKKNDDELIIPIKDNEILNDDIKDKVVEAEFELKKSKKSFKEEAKKIVGEENIDKLKTSYDIVGDIAILEIDEDLRYEEKKIAEKLLECNDSIKTVVRKKGSHEGKLRLQDYKVLAGENKLSTYHKENGCTLHIILNEVYYSPRTSTERKRIAEKIVNGENVLVMFSGCGPFVCVIAKNSFAEKVTGIELNKKGHELAKENIRINKINNSEMIEGDVREVCKYMGEKEIKFDRIVMPLPMTAEEFLPEAIKVSKKGTIVHLYDFVDERKFPDITVNKIKDYLSDEKFKVLDYVKCGQFSPHIFRVCVDFKVL